MRIIGFVSALVFAAPVLAAGAIQQTADVMSGWGANSAYNRLYNPKTEVSITGTVTGIMDGQSPMNGMTPATSILVKAGNGGVATVDLGPTWFLSHQNQKLAIGDRVSVTGSKVFVDNKSLILARKVTKSGRVAYLREIDGFPMWVAVRTGEVNNNLTAAVNNGQAAASPMGPVPVANTPPVNANSAVASNANSNTNTTQTVQTINGTLQKTVTVNNPQTGVPETYALVNTPQGVVQVDLGPQWFIQQQGINWGNGGPVVVQGTPGVQAIQTAPGAPPIYIANGMTYGNQVMVFRGPNGPVWSPFGP